MHPQKNEAKTNEKEENNKTYASTHTNDNNKNGPCFLFVRINCPLALYKCFSSSSFNIKWN